MFSSKTLQTSNQFGLTCSPNAEPAESSRRGLYENLSHDDLSYAPWYHGILPRFKAEDILKQEYGKSSKDGLWLVKFHTSDS